MAIQDDFGIDYINQRLYHSTGTTVYTVNEYYSWLQDEFEELIQMDDPVPMSAQTPTEYTVVNGWFFDIGEDSEIHKYLRGGAITTSGYDGAIRMLKLESFGAHTFTSSDIGGEIGYSGGSPTDVGTLLGYDNTNYYLWVRTTDNFSDTTTILDLDDTTSLDDLIDYNGSLTGEELYANIYTLGTIATNPYAQIYVYQKKDPLTEWSDLSNWDRGHIDVLLQVKEMGTEIDDAVVKVFIRQGGDLYNHYEIDLTAGGRNAVPLSTGTDLDNDDTGEYYLLYDGETGGGFSVGDIVVGATSEEEAEIIAITDWGTEGLLTLIGVSGDFTDNENLQVSATNRGVANGSAGGCIGDTYVTFDSQTANFTLGNIITGATSGAKRILIGQQDDGATGKLVLEVDPAAASNQDDYYVAYQSGENLSDEGTGDGATTMASTQTTSFYQDIKVWFVNLALAFDGGTGDFAIGEKVTGGTSGSVGYSLTATSGATGTLTLGNVTGAFQDGETLTGSLAGAAVADGTGEITHTLNKAMEQQSAYPYDVIIDMNEHVSSGRTVTQLYEHLKWINRWDSAYDLYRVQRPWVEHAEQYDTSGTTYTDETADLEDSTADDVAVFDGDPEIDDAFYIGMDDQFSKFSFNLTTQGSGTWTITWEYYNGAGWSALTHDNDAGVGVDTANADQFTAATGWHYVWWDIATNWAKTAVDGVNKYWVRARISAFTSSTTDPLLGQGYVWQIYLPEKGEEYITAFYGYTEKPASPFGTFAGGIFFGAQGVWIEGMVSTDAQNYQLTDSNGVLRLPPNKQAITVVNVVSGDRVTVFQLTGNGGTVKKNMYTSHATNNTQGDTEFEVTTAIDIDTPSDGVLRVVDNAEEEEYRIRYASWSGSIFTFETERTGTQTGSSDPVVLQDSGASFQTWGILAGDIIRNTTTNDWTHIKSVDSQNQVTTEPLKGGGDNSWDNTDGYSIHTLPNATDGSDTAYVPFIDEEATATSVSVTVIYTADRDIEGRLRKKGIIPFALETDFDSDGVTINAIRTTDSIVT